MTTQDMSVSTLCNTPSNFYVGKVATFWTSWLSLTSDAAILNTINGVEIDFMTDYLQGSSPPKIPFCEADFLKTDLEISRLLDKRVIQWPTHESGEFISNIFFQVKKNGNI